MEPIPCQAAKLWQMVQAVLKGNYYHVYKIFVKSEPHSEKKILEKRWRLIMMSSLPVQICWHMALEHLAKPLLKPFVTPLTHGMVYFGGGWKLFRYYLKQHNLNWTADKSGWDWNSHGWVYEVALELLKRLSPTEDIEQNDPSWTFVLNWLFKDAFCEKKVLLPDGTILQQKEEGLMPSGCVWTIQLNGIGQVCLHVLALKRMNSKVVYRLLATGDDTIQEMPSCVDQDEYRKQLQLAGCIVKECGFGNDFMGFEIAPTGFYPKYLEKHIQSFKLQKKEFQAETLEGYLRIYCHDEDLFDFWKMVANILGYKMPSRKYFLYFADNPDALESYSFARPSFGDRQVSDDVVV